MPHIGIETEVVTAGSQARRYWAFISYSSKDRRFGSWLHRRLENFPIPEEFRGSEVFDGAVLGKNLRPIFRDRDELSGSADLGAAIQRALERSHFLVVLCSKHSAQSKWVNQEIESFRALKGEANILALILDGVPNATSTAGVDNAEECFPPALRYPREPLAGDLRKSGDGKERGFLKVVAGIAQLDFDRLYRRHERMQQRRRFWIGVGAVSIICMMAGLSTVAWHQSQVAKKERNEALVQEQHAIEERNRADAARIEANHSTSDLLLANGARSIAQGRWGDATVQLAAAWKTNPESEEANLLLPIALRQLEGGQEVMRGHPTPISLMRFAPPNGELVTASEDGQILVRDGNGGKILHDFQDHLLAVRVADFFDSGESGTLMATSGDDRRIHLYQIDSGELLYRNLSHLDKVLGLEFSANGRRLLSWSSDATLVIHSWKPGDTPVVIRAFDHGSIRFAAWIEGGAQILAVHHTGKITRWDAHKGTLLDEGECASSDSLDEPVTCATLDPSGKWLAVGTRDQGIRFWDVAEHRMAATLEGQAAGLWDLRFVAMPEPLFPGESYLFLQAVHVNGMIERWLPHRGMRAPDYHSVAALDGSRLPAATDICADGAFQALGDSRGGLRIVHAPSGLVLNAADAYHGACTSMAFSPDGLSLWTGGADGNIRRWQMRGRRIMADQAGLRSVDVHQASDRLLSGGNDGMARLWDLTTGELLGEMRHAPPGNMVTAAKFSKNGGRLLTGGGNEVRLWDTENPEEPMRVISIEDPHWVRDAAFCENEQAVVVAVRTYIEKPGSSPTTWSDGDGWRVFDLASGEETSRRYTRYSGIEEVASFDAAGNILWRALHHAGIDAQATGLRTLMESELTCFRVGHADDTFFGTLDGGLQRFNVHGTRMWAAPGSGSRMEHLAVDGSGGLVSGIDMAGQINLVEYDDGNLHRRISMSGRHGVATALPADSAMVFGALQDGQVGIWHRHNGRSLLRFAHHANELFAMKHLADPQAIVTVARDGRAWVFDCGWEAEFELDESQVLERVWQALTTGKDFPKPHAETSELMAALQTISMPGSARRLPEMDTLEYFQSGDWQRAWEALENQIEVAHSPVMTMARSILRTRRKGLVAVSEPLPASITRLEAGPAGFFALDADGAVWAWEANTGLRSLDRVPAGSLPRRMAISPDGTRLILAGRKPEFDLCDARDGSPIFALAGMEKPVVGGTFSADGNAFYGWGNDSQIIGWSVADGAMIWEAGLPAGTITRDLTKVSLQGRPHLQLMTNTQVHLFDLASNVVERIPESDEASENLPFPGWQVGMTSDGSTAILGGPRLRIYDRDRKEFRGELDTDGKEVSMVSIVENDTIAVAGTSDGWLYAYSLPGGERLAKTSLPGGGDMLQLDGVAGKPWLIASSHESGAWLCSVPDLKLLAHLKFDQVETAGVKPQARYAIAHDGATVATTSTDGRIYLWDLALAASGTGQSEVLHFDPVIPPLVTTERVILVSDDKSRVELRDASDGQLAMEIPIEPHERLAAMHLSEDRSSLLLDRWVKDTDSAEDGIEKREWRVIDLADPTSDTTVNFQIEQLIDGFFKLPDGRGWLATGLSGENGAWLIAMDPEGAPRWRWDSGKGTGMASRNFLQASDGVGGRVLIANTDGRSILLNAEQGEVLREYSLGGSGAHWISAAWDASDRSLVTVNRGGTIHIWDVENGTLRKAVHGLGIRPMGLRLVTGRRLLVEGDEGQAEVWDLERETRLLRLDRNANRTAVRCTPDGEWCLAGDRSGRVEVWHIGQGKRVGRFAFLAQSIDEIFFLGNGRVLLTSRNGMATKFALLPSPQKTPDR